MTPTGPTPSVRRLLVANRGEIARRVFRTARNMGIESVAVVSDADQEAPHVHDADLAVRLAGASATQTYLNVDAVLAAAEAVGADSVHPGYGFLAESAAFARAVEAAGLTWVGPAPDAIAAMGDKIAAKALVTQVGVPVAPGEEVNGDDPAQWLDAAGRVGFPLLVKASAGGGGKGMRAVAGPDQLAEAVEGARREAASTFADPTVFLERLVVGARHVEVQVVGDQHGARVHVFERECSVQRRHQKVFEEAPAPALTNGTRERMYQAALAVAAAVDYTGVGTVEFLVEGAGDAAQFYFLEMNTRLQVEHPVTEAITGLDLVRLQIEIARGKPLTFTQSDVVRRGHAVEARLYAEDPASGYLPQSGPVHRFATAETVAGVRYDSGVESGSVVTPHYDALLAKVVAHASTRDEAVDQLARALRGLQVHGPITNRDLLVGVLADEDFRAGRTTTDFLATRPHLVQRHRDLDAVVRHAVAATLAGQQHRRTGATVQTSVPSGWRNVDATWPVTSLTLDEVAIDVSYRVFPDNAFAARVAGVRSDPVEVVGRLHQCRAGARATGSDWALDLELDGVRRHVDVADHGDGAWWTDAIDGHLRLVEQPRFAESTREGVAGGPTAPVPGTVTHVAVVVGEAVTAGQTLVVLEAMKMEHRIVADVDAVVHDVLVASGDSVDAHQELVTLEPIQED